MNKKIAILSIDPGSNDGMFCLLIPEIKQVAFKKTTDKPLDLYAWIKQIETEYSLQVIMIEDVRNIFGVSSKSNFTFGVQLGLVTGISQATGNTVDKVQPKKWQTFLGVKTTTKGKAIKKEVATLVESLYPKVNLYGPKGGLQAGKSDSLAIAHFAAYKYKLQ